MTDDEAAALRAAAEAVRAAAVALKKAAARDVGSMGSEEYDAALGQADEAREVFQEAASPAVVLSLLAEREALRAALRDIAADCEADYPPSHGAIKQAARAALSGSAAP